MLVYIFTRCDGNVYKASIISFKHFAYLFYRLRLGEARHFMHYTDTVGIDHMSANTNADTMSAYLTGTGKSPQIKPPLKNVWIGVALILLAQCSILKVPALRPINIIYTGYVRVME